MILDSGLNLGTLVRELAVANNQYYEIGILLGIDGEKLKEIEKEYKETTRRFSEMFLWWLKGNGVTVSWEPLVSALESPLVGHRILAEAMKTKYIKSKEITSTLTSQGTVHLLVAKIIVVPV